jgi:hypothetical protein
MTALQIKCFCNSLTRNIFFNCPELLFLKGMTGALAPFRYLVLNIILSDIILVAIMLSAIILSVIMPSALLY